VRWGSKALSCTSSDQGCVKVLRKQEAYAYRDLPKPAEQYIVVSSTSFRFYEAILDFDTENEPS